MQVEIQKSAIKNIFYYINFIMIRNVKYVGNWDENNFLKIKAENK